MYTGDIRAKETGQYVGYVPGFMGSHSQRKPLDELNKILHEVIAILLEDGMPELERVKQTARSS